MIRSPFRFNYADENDCVRQALFEISLIENRYVEVLLQFESIFTAYTFSKFKTLFAKAKVHS